MNRYENGKIYKIVDVGYNKCYIGSTCEKLSKRMDRHRNCYKRYLETGKGDTNALKLFDEYGVENCKIVLIENYPCNDKEDLLRKEGEHIRNTECVNKQVAGRTPQEYKQHYKERYKQQQKERYETNKELILKGNKEYREQHKEHIIQISKKYYQKNKDEILEKHKQPFYCECGGCCCYNVKARHFRSNKHKDWIKKQEQKE